jgi:hypothetical protein
MKKLNTINNYVVSSISIFLKKIKVNRKKLITIYLYKTIKEVKTKKHG